MECKVLDTIWKNYYRQKLIDFQNNSCPVVSYLPQMK